MQTGIPRTSGGSVGRNRSGVLELAVLGLLNGTPMHGYELRKRLYTFSDRRPARARAVPAGAGGSGSSSVISPAAWSSCRQGYSDP